MGGNYLAYPLTLQRRATEAEALLARYPEQFWELS
ncbi:hypothetical protein OsccyDRAFT_2111 [Leptolyngbyaceae cyanobacterium JSC-12]|nr:hypothetical protein OsccyDRAFT_2111 [Leptolyngbyaceae cyanobacterium JSC-12]